jgi:hypothetical protein
VRFDRSGANHIAFVRGFVDARVFRCLHAEPSGLYIKAVAERLVVLVHVNRRSGAGSQLRGSADVIDVRMGDHDHFHRESMTFDDVDDFGDVVAWINNNRFARRLITEDGAVAGKRPDGQYFVDHWFPIR